MTFWRGPFSNFAAARITLPHPITGVPTPYATVEHFFQAAKATTTEDHDWINAAPTAGIAKRRGSPRGEQGRRITLGADWDDVRYDTMLVGLRAKFAITHFRQILLSTGTRPLAEDSPYDATWGIRARDGSLTGRNLLGRALMQVRAEIASRGLATFVDDDPSPRPSS